MFTDIVSGILQSWSLVEQAFTFDFDHSEAHVATSYCLRLLTMSQRLQGKVAVRALAGAGF